MGDRRNLARVLAAAPELARRLRETEVTLGALRKEYHAAWPTMLRALLTQMDFAEYRRLARLRNARGGRKTRFPKGHIPWAAGKKLGRRPGCEPTQFTTGQLRGMAARNWRPVGTILIRFDRPPRRTRGRKNGRPGRPRRWIKVAEEGPRNRRWIPWARYLWQQRFGPIPAGMLIGHADGDTLNDDLENLICITRRENLLRLKTIRPNVPARRAAAAARATRKRHRAEAAMKARGRPVTTYECMGCGTSLPAPPDPCPKCGGFAHEVLRRRPGETVRIVGDEEGGPPE